MNFRVIHSFLNPIQLPSQLYLIVNIKKNTGAIAFTSIKVSNDYDWEKIERRIQPLIKQTQLVPNNIN